MKKCILITILFANVLWLYSQRGKSSLDKLYQEARSQYERGNFEKSAELYLKLIEQDPTSFIYSYELGLLYFYELNNKKESIPFLKRALENMKDTIPDLFNYLGQAYQANLDYDKAIEMYQTYSAIPPKPGVLKISMKKYIEQCIEEKEKIVKILEARKEVGETGVRVFNAGRIVNSEFNDFAPLILDNNRLIFSSARDFDYQFGVYVTKPYLAIKEPNGTIKTIERLISTEYAPFVFDQDWHLIITGFSPDLTKMLYTYEDLIYLREGAAEAKIDPIKLPKEINFAKKHTAATISANGLSMVFSAFDSKLKCWNLYISTRSNDGVWRKAEKIEKLSTTKDENYPFLSPDGYTLYFSSTGHGAMGGFDIFKSTMQDNGEWSIPERLPTPINSEHNDIWFTISPDGKKAYFSSDRPGGFGMFDIYEVNY